jgi:predicted ATPase
MIRKVELTNFKSHKDTKLDFSNLTVLCGKNSSGKTSVIQALLLLRDAYINQYDSRIINLNPKLVKIGTANDALFRSAQEDKIMFGIDTDLQNVTFISSITDLTKDFIPFSGSNTNIIKTEPLFDRSFQFLSAYRIGPKALYSKNDLIEIHNQISDNEGMAENTIPFLYKKQNCLVIPEVCIPAFDSYLINQVSAWENEISNGVRVDVEDNVSHFELKYKYGNDEFNAINVGFGLTYALPVITAILSAPKGAILFIENPEAHLHPKGQAKLAELICLATQAGIQIVIETHSDHIFNGIRKAISQKKIEKEKVKVHYFDLKDNSFSENTEIHFSDTGRILNYKEGLFDQFDNDLDELLGL